MAIVKDEHLSFVHVVTLREQGRSAVFLCFGDGDLEQRKELK